jgi:hypothetical protein
LPAHLAQSGVIENRADLARVLSKAIAVYADAMDVNSTLL